MAHLSIKKHPNVLGHSQSAPLGGCVRASHYGPPGPETPRVAEIRGIFPAEISQRVLFGGKHRRICSGVHQVHHQLRVNFTGAHLLGDVTLPNWLKWTLQSHGNVLSKGGKMWDPPQSKQTWLAGETHPSVQYRRYMSWGSGNWMKLAWITQNLNACGNMSKHVR